MSTEGHQEGTFILGPLSTIEDVDEGACALLGYSRAELIGRHGSELIPLARRPRVAAVLDQMRQGDLTFAAPGVLMRKDGSELHVEVTARRRPNRRLLLRVRATSRK